MSAVRSTHRLGKASSSWADCWEWSRRRRPNLLKGVHDALDAIEAAQKADDRAGNMEACRGLQRTVQGAADAFQAEREAATRETVA